MGEVKQSGWWPGRPADRQTDALRLSVPLREKPANSQTPEPAVHSAERPGWVCQSVAASPASCAGRGGRGGCGEPLPAGPAHRAAGPAPSSGRGLRPRRSALITKGHLLGRHLRPPRGLAVMTYERGRQGLGAAASHRCGRQGSEGCRGGVRAPRGPRGSSEPNSQLREKTQGPGQRLTEVPGFTWAHCPPGPGGA